MKEILSNIGLFIALLYGVKFICKACIKPLYAKVPFKSNTAEFYEKYSPITLQEQIDNTVPQNISKPEAAEIEPVKSIENNNSHKFIVDTEKEKTPTENTEPLKITKEQTQSVKNNKGIVTSFPKNKSALNKIPKLDFSWQPRSMCVDEGSQEQKEKENIPENDHSLFAMLPPEENHYYENIDDIPTRIEADYFITEERKYEHTNEKSYKNGSLLGENTSKISDINSRKNGKILSVTNSSSASDVIVKIIGEEGRHLHVKASSRSMWVEVKDSVSPASLKKGSWYKLKIKYLEGHHFPLVLQAEEFSAPSTDFIMGDDLSNYEWEKQGLAAYRS